PPGSALPNSRAATRSRSHRYPPMMNAMPITKDTVAQKVSAYLYHDLSLSQLVDWAESAMMDGELHEPDAATLVTVLSRLGVADVRAFGLTWDDCQSLLRQLGYSAHVQVVAA